MTPHVVLSYVQAEPLLRARQGNRTSLTISPDLGRSSVEVTLHPDGVAFPSGPKLDWATIQRIAESPTKCFVATDDGIREITAFSEETNRVYTLYPTTNAPTMLISGVLMHRIKGTDPHQDTLQKIRAIAPVVGRVLDTATGLGYTAIEAAKTADEVVTIELDPVALEIARQNPWSRELFDNPKIVQIVGDSFEEVQKFETESFSRIIHDPPVFSLAGELYSTTFYRELYRVLRQRGRLFHYIGDLESRSGRNTMRGVVRRLQEAGFSRVSPRQAAFGVVAFK